MNDVNQVLSSFSNSINQRKQTDLTCQQKRLDENKSLSSIDVHTNKMYLSSSSLNSDLKELNLTESDLTALRQALTTIYSHAQSLFMYDHRQLLKQRLTSPYMQKYQRNSKCKMTEPLLCTDECCVRNGLLNHNDGPSMYHPSLEMCCSKSNVDLQTCSSSCHITSTNSNISPTKSSSVNIKLPLQFLSNQNYLFKALTSNFIEEKTRTRSIILRHNKVQAWEKENHLQEQSPTINTCPKQSEEFKQFTSVRISSICNNDKASRNHRKSIGNGHSSTRRKLLKTFNIDELFPMVKVLAPFIVIHGSISQTLTCNRLMTIADSETSENYNSRTKSSGKRSFIDITDASLLSMKRPSLSVD